MNTLLTTFAFIAALFALALPASIVFLALKLKAGIVVNVAAPTALLPERVQATLDAINEKLTPALNVLTDTEVMKLVHEGVVLAEQSELKGTDRFFIAKDHVMKRADALGAQLDGGDIARRIEAVLALTKALKATVP